MAKVQTIGSISDFMAGKHHESAIDRLVKELKAKLTPANIERAMKYGMSLTAPVTIGTVAGAKAFAAPAVAVVAAPAGATYAAGSTVALAAMAPAAVEGAKALAIKAFDPLINLLQTLSYPIAGVMIVSGCLMIMVGMKDKGVDMLRNAAIGYILVQLSPLFLKILVGLIAV